MGGKAFCVRILFKVGYAWSVFGESEKFDWWRCKNNKNYRRYLIFNWEDFKACICEWWEY